MTDHDRILWMHRFYDLSLASLVTYVATLSVIALALHLGERQRDRRGTVPSLVANKSFTDDKLNR